MEIFNQTVGWLGAFLVVLAYLLVSTKKLTGTSRSYQLLNLIGAVGVGLNAFHQQAWPSFSIQILWGAVALATLLKVFFSRRLNLK